MEKISQKFCERFTDEDLVTILQAAMFALADGEVFDSIAEKMDIADSELKSLQERVATFMNE